VIAQGAPPISTETALILVPTPTAVTLMDCPLYPRDGEIELTVANPVSYEKLQSDAIGQSLLETLNTRP
jgi:hypothetical protein